MGKAFRWLLVGIALTFAGMWYYGRQQAAHAERKIIALEATKVALQAHADSLAAHVQTDTVRVNQWHDRWHAVTAPYREPGDTQPVPHEVITVADSVIVTDSVAIQHLAALVHAKDSLYRNSEAQVAEWRTLARGRLVRPSGEILYRLDGHLSIAGEVQVGRGKTSLLVRYEKPLDAAGGATTKVGIHISF